jgi:hypothetical protein|nr:MAG TPA: hypothetical protein [Caudoviricetes sp.]
MIVDSKDKFEGAITIAVDVTGKIYNKMSVYLSDAEEWIKGTLLGTPLYEKIGDFPASQLKQAELIVSLRAFIEAIPFLDLVLTPTGFGIVSTNAIAPASKERVDRLQQKAQNVLDDAVDSFLFSLNSSELRLVWMKGETFEALTSSLIWYAEELRQYAGMKDLHRSGLLELRTKITAAEMLISDYISDEYLKELIQSLRKNSIERGTDDDLMVSFLRRVIGLELQGDHLTAVNMLERIVNSMEMRLPDFKIYAGSQVYKLKHSTYYENKKDDSVYFFG